MIDAVILLLVSVLFAFCIVAVWKLFPFYRLIKSVTENWENQYAASGAEGGIANAAKRGSKGFLSDLVKMVLQNASGGLSELAVNAFPVIEEWLDKNPAAVIYAFAMLRNIPLVQGFLKNLPQLGEMPLPMLQTPNENVGIDNGQTQKAWWQA